jgi:methylated-DNA-[protein]-cysteine S-methyltransferase
MAVVMDTGFTLFTTAIGTCGLAWNADGIVAVQLPEATEERTRARLAARAPGALERQPPPVVCDAAAAITALLRGEAIDLADVPLDLSTIGPFDRTVYAIARTIAPGHTLTYGQIAERLGTPGAAREVGQSLGRNPFPIVVPCHRVVAAGGAMHGFSAPGGTATKLRLLTIEGALPPTLPSLFDA